VTNSGGNNGRGRGKFFSELDMDANGNFSGFGGGSKKPVFPPPVKKPHLPPGGNPLTAYNINSDY
jgi:hypothetical protein